MLPVILLVDDEEDILDFLERILQTKYTILKAADGREALTQLAADRCSEYATCDKADGLP